MATTTDHLDEALGHLIAAERGLPAGHPVAPAVADLVNGLTRIRQQLTQPQRRTA